MRTTLLAILFVFFTQLAFAESAVVPNQEDGFVQFQDPPGDRFTFSVFPNPATEYFRLTNDEHIARIIIYNLVGREMRAFEASKGDKYNVSGLPNGMYLVQAMGANNKVLATQRLQKR